MIKFEPGKTYVAINGSGATITVIKTTEKSALIRESDGEHWRMLREGNRSEYVICSGSTYNALNAAQDEPDSELFGDMDAVKAALERETRTEVSDIYTFGVVRDMLRVTADVDGCKETFDVFNVSDTRIEAVMV